MLSSRAIFPISRAAASRATISSCIAVAPFGVRTYAQAAPTPDSKPPVALFGLDGTYASALYTAAAKSSTLDSTAKSLATLSDVFKKDPKLPVILTAPTLTPGDKSQIVQELQRHMGGVDKGDTVKNFLNTLAENNRLGILEGVCEKFSMLMGAYRGEVDLTITSASKLDSKLIQRLETAVAKSEYSQGKKLKVINPDIMGGLVVEIGERTIDRAVSSKISRMNKALTDAL
ncbi:MAG: ATP synthase F0 subcomplex subunit OSCP atp5 [Pleopsidium flavum]|nr:MAG: ATP synthase F0 subcomplex subunit OSCP atp5 [Pleopsidium flavum]